MDNRYRKINELLVFIGRRRKQIGEIAMGTLNILPSHHFALAALRHMGRAVSQTQIAEMMRVTPASVARTMKSLDKKGYIERSSGEDDVRRNEIAITPKGEQVLSQSCVLFRNLDECSYAGFSDEELNQLQGMLEKMLNNLSQIKEGMEEEMNK